MQRNLFCEKEYDTTSGLNLYDFGARLYDPAAPHFLSPDPLQESYYPWNAYAYCLNNPVKYVDPEGKVIETAWDIANVVMDARSLYDNILQKNYKAAAVDAGAFVLDAAATALPAVPAGFGTALKTARTSQKAVKTVKATKYNYRKLLQKATGKEGKGFEAHHTLPQKYRKQFEKLEINIDEPGKDKFELELFNSSKQP